jgi:hypothetical protein
VKDPVGDRDSRFDDTICPVDFEQYGQITSDTCIEFSSYRSHLVFELQLFSIAATHSAIRARFAVFVMVDSRRRLRSSGVVYLSRPRRYIFHYWFFLRLQVRRRDCLVHGKNVDIALSKRKRTEWLVPISMLNTTYDVSVQSLRCC